jgi:hypothetical protein
VSEPTGVGSSTSPTPHELQQLFACSEPTAVLLNHPDGGTVFNNAMTSADAGFIDRTRGVLDAIASKKQSIRCCFDPWLRGAPAARGRVLVRLTLAPEGAVTGAEIDSARTDIDNGTTHACLVAVLRGIDYPASPTGKPTTVEYPFVVGASAP